MSLIQHRARSIECRAPFIDYYALCEDCRSVFIEYRALFVDHRSFFMKYSSLCLISLIEHRARLIGVCVYVCVCL